MTRPVQVRILAVDIMLAFFFALVTVAAADAAIVDGAVLVPGGPLAGGIVKAYRSLKDTWNGPPAAVSTSGDKPGLFRLELVPGTYYLVGSGTVDGREYAAFYGGNPVTVDTKDRKLSLMLNPVVTPQVKPAATSRLSGTVTLKGVPLAGARVTVYRAAEGEFRGMGFVAATTGSDGTFVFALQPDDYLVVARKRQASVLGMPLREGDIFCYLPRNPLTVRKETETAVTVPCYPVTAPDRFVEQGVPLKGKPGAALPVK